MLDPPSTQHTKTVLSEITSSSFSSVFHDVTLVFEDGEEVLHYKALLSLLSLEWRLLLKLSPFTDVVFLPDIKVEDMFGKVTETFKDDYELSEMFDKEHHPQQIVVDIKKKDEDEIQEKIEEQYHIADNPLEKTNDNVLHNNIAKSENENQLVPFNQSEEILDLSDHHSPVYLPAIQDDFSWPPDLQAPNFHSMGWRRTPDQRGGEVVDVMGNKSLFAILSLRLACLPERAAFSLPLVGDQESELAGVFYVKDFINGQAASSLPVFQLEDSSDRLSLEQLVTRAGHLLEQTVVWAEALYDPKQGLAGRILVFTGAEISSLKKLTEVWKKNLEQDSQGHELEVGSTMGWGQKKLARQRRQVFLWCRKRCLKTVEGGIVCFFCGFVCFKQSERHNFTSHIHRHLFRQKKVQCPTCAKFYMRELAHVCEGSRQIKQQIKLLTNCDLCNSCFSRKSELRRHMRQTHGIIPQDTQKCCQFCELIIPRMDMHKHVTDHHRGDFIKCKQCEEPFSNSTSYKHHYLNKHTEKLSGFCNICQQKYRQIKKHNFVRHKQENYPCTHCDKIYKSEQGLDDHMKTVNGTMVRKQCPICSKFLINLNDHTQRVHRGNMKLNKCRTCKKTIQVDQILEHKMFCKPELHTCHICSKKVHHLQSHLSAVHTDFKCGVCGQIFSKTKNRPVLRDHILLEHIPKIFVELGIIEDLKTNNNTKQDAIAKFLVEKKTTKDKNMVYNCLLCLKMMDSGTKAHNHMKAHMNWHTNTKDPANCHVKESKTYKCDKCKRAFAQEEDMKTHILTHNTECKICNKTLSDPYKLRKHLLMHDKYIKQV